MLCKQFLRILFRIDRPYLFGMMRQRSNDRMIKDRVSDH